MNLLTKIKTVLFDPRLFFEKIQSETDFKIAFSYFFVLALFGIMMGALLSFSMQGIFNGYISNVLKMSIVPMTGIYFLQIGIFIFILKVLFSFLFTAILNGWISSFGGKGNYLKTYQLYVYSRTPSLLFGWIPIVGLFAWVYSFSLLIIGTKEVHQLETKKVIMLYFIPLAIILIFVFLYMVLMIMVIKYNPEIFAEILSLFPQ
jgi:hypothetical protein